MPTISSLTVNLKGDSTSLVKATRTSLRAIGNLTRGIGRSVLKVGGLAGAITGLAGGAGLVALGRASARNVDAIGKLSTQLGISGTDVQKLGLVAELSGMKTEGLTKAMQRVTRIVGDAGAGGKEAAKLFERLGLSVDDLIKADPVKRFEMVIGALKAMTAETERASVGNKLFEEQWQRINPLIEGFSDAMARAVAVYDTAGFGIGNLSKGVESLNDNVSVIQATFTAFRDLLFGKVSPDINRMVVDLGRLGEAWIKANGGAGALADTLISKLGTAVPRVLGWFDNLKNAATGIVWVIEQVVKALRAVGIAGAGLAASGAALLDGNFSGAAAIMGGLPGDVAGAFSGADEDDPATQELERQTELLREVVRNGATGGLAFG